MRLHKLYNLMCVHLWIYSLRSAAWRVINTGNETTNFFIIPNKQLFALVIVASFAFIGRLNEINYMIKMPLTFSVDPIKNKSSKATKYHILRIFGPNMSHYFILFYLGQGIKALAQHRKITPMFAHRKILKMWRKNSLIFFFCHC